MAIQEELRRGSFTINLLAGAEDLFCANIFARQFGPGWNLRSYIVR